MTKAIGDIIDRVQGAATALRGVRARLTRLPPDQPAPASTPEVPPAAPPPPTQEDYDHAKQVIAEMKGQLDALEAEVSRESKVPELEHPADAKSAQSKKAG
jgi:hypothetical protein